MEKGRIDITLERDDKFCLRANFALEPRGITVLFGPSGCGKTTLLRCVAGLNRGEGLVRIGEQVWQDDSQNLFIPTYKRRLGYVFQEASLFEHLTAKGNIDFARKRATHPVSDRRLQEIVNLLGIGDVLSKSSTSLSGGERQRVAIARALSVTPDILLMDEPLSALDMKRKQEFLPWLEKLREELSIPILYVTHSVSEMRQLSDRILLLENGKMIDEGTPREVLYRRGLREQSEGIEVLIEGTVESVDSTWNISVINSSGLRLEVTGTPTTVGHKARMGILARDVSLTLLRPEASSIRNIVETSIEEMQPLEGRGQVLVTLNAYGQKMFAMISALSVHHLNLQVGQRVFAQIKAVSLVQ